MQSPAQLAKTSGVGVTGKQLQPAETLAPKRPCRGGMTHPGKLQVRLMSCPSLLGHEIQPCAHLDPLGGQRATTDCSDQHCPDVGSHSISAVGVQAVARQQVNSPPVSTKSVAISSTFRHRHPLLAVDAQGRGGFAVESG